MKNVIIMFNHAGFSDNAYLCLRMRLLAQAAFFFNALFLWWHKQLHEGRSYFP